jgi:hypothetical protein
MHPEPTLYTVTTPAGTAFTTYSATLARAHAALGASVAVVACAA